MTTRMMLSGEARQVLATWYSESLIDDTPVLKGSLFGKFFGMFNQQAVTIRGRVHLTSHAPALDSDYGIMLVGHELFHVEDQLARGWGSYLFAYIRGWRPAHIKNGSSHPMERDAYARGSEVMRLVQAQRHDSVTSQ